MNRTQVTLLGLLLLQLVLILVFRSPFSGGAARTEARPLLPQLDAITPARIQIDGSEDERITLSRDGEEWAIDEIGGFPADSEKVERLLEDLEGIEVRRPVVSSASYHDAFQVAANDYEARLRVWSAEAEEPGVDLILGSSANYRTTHARRGDRDEVYEIQGVAPYDVRPDFGSWIRKEITDEVGDVRRLALTNASGRFELERRDGLWAIASPEGMREEELDQDEVLGLLRQVTELRLADAAGPVDETAHGFGEPAATLELSWRSGGTEEEDGESETLTLRIGGKVADRETQRYVTVEGSGFAGMVWESSLDRLIEDSLEDLRAEANSG